MVTTQDIKHCSQMGTYELKTTISKKTKGTVLIVYKLSNFERQSVYISYIAHDSKKIYEDEHTDDGQDKKQYSMICYERR